VKRFLIPTFIAALTVFLSCDVPDNYFKPVPDCVSDTANDLNVTSQKKLVDKLQDQKPSDFRYFFKSFEEEGDQTYMITNFRNEESCFDIRLLVDKWDKLAGMKRANGVSYPKELYDLEWEIVETEAGIVASYVDMHRIID